MLLPRYHFFVPCTFFECLPRLSAQQPHQLLSNVAIGPRSMRFRFEPNNFLIFEGSFLIPLRRSIILVPSLTAYFLVNLLLGIGVVKASFAPSGDHVDSSENQSPPCLCKTSVVAST